MILYNDCLDYYSNKMQKQFQRYAFVSDFDLTSVHQTAKSEAIEMVQYELNHLIRIKLTEQLFQAV